MKRVLLSIAAIACMAAAPQQRGLITAVPPGPIADRPPGPAAPSPNRFQPAPTPNRDVEAPFGGPGSNQPSVSPTLINRRDTYRGEGFSRGSSPSEEQDKKVRPGAGFNFRMPFAPN